MRSRKSGSLADRLFAWLKLSALAARRTLPAGLALIAALGAFFALRGDFTGGGQETARFDLAGIVSAAGGLPERSGSLRFLYASQGLLALLLAALAPLLVWRTAHHASGSTRSADRHWLDSRPASPLFIATAQWLGSAFAAALCIVGFMAAIAFVRPAALADLEAPAGVATGPPNRLLAAEDLRWSAPQTMASKQTLRARLSLRLISGGSDPVLNVEFAARRLGQTSWNTSLVRVGDGAPLVVDLPPGDGAPEFVLRRVEGGARALLRSKDVRLYRSVPWSTGCLHMSLRLLGAFSAALALSLGFAAFISGPSAAAAALLPWVLALLAPGRRLFAFLPGGDLPIALEEWTEGRTLAGLTPTAWIGWVALVLLGLSLATLGRRRAES